MRFLGTTVGLGLVLLLAGCDPFHQFHNQQPHPPIPAEVPSKEALVSYLNDNAQRIQSIDCRRPVDLDVKQGIRPSIGLTGRLVCQKQRNFRLQADWNGKTEVDMGSNQTEFWYWIAKGDPYLVHCSYEDLARGVKTPFPFQPEWIMETLGMADHDASRMTLAVKQNTLELVENGTGPQGQPVRKVIVLSRAQVTPGRPQINAYVLQDANGTQICSARIVETHYDPASGAVVPQKVVLRWDAERVELTLRLNGMIVNGNIPANQATALFTRPPMAGVASYDLARGPDRPAGTVQRTGGVFR
jgi:hypothetical protein